MVLEDKDPNLPRRLDLRQQSSSADSSPLPKKTPRKKDLPKATQSQAGPSAVPAKRPSPEDAEPSSRPSTPSQGGPSTRPAKRQASEDPDPTSQPSISARRVSAAARWNNVVFKRMAKALEKDPEVDLATVFPSAYSSRLNEMRSKSSDMRTSHRDTSTTTPLHSSSPANTASPALIRHPLSDAVKSIFRSYDDGVDFSDGSDLSPLLAQVLDNLELIHGSDTKAARFVGKCGPEVVVKRLPICEDLTEYTTLQYLESQKPHLPVPRGQGVIVKGTSAYIFQTYIPGPTLEQVWPQLDARQKISISEQLDDILLDLRTLELPTGAPLGGVGREGCKDLRRNLRKSTQPLYSASQFWNFQYCEGLRGSRMYLEFLRGMTRPFQETKCVFTHGDIRPSNIILRLQDDRSYSIAGIIDWEVSGFYPEDFECTKITNCLSPLDKLDWYLYLPSCVSPMRHPCRWLSDCVWDSRIV